MLKLYPDTASPSTPEVEKKKEDTLLFDVGGNKLYFISLGCPRNRVDTEVMLGIALKNGYEITAEIKQADYIIINTCGFLEAAREESLATIGEVFATRKKKAKVIVTGCMVQSHRIDIEKRYKEIDYFLGSGEVESILQAIQAKEKGGIVTSARSYLQAGEVPRRISTPSHYAYLKIAEGCKKRCAYCIIPTIKGPLRSKPLQRVVEEFRLLLDQGVKEIILIAQDLGDWGKDLGYRRAEGLTTLMEALLCDERPFWLRLLYLYPDEITPDLIKILKRDKRVCRYLDMPIQHVNDEVLKAMHRKTTRKEIIHTLALLRESIPDIAIRTSLIVGFPGEREEQFQELVNFLSDYKLDEVGIFTYSRERGSAAYSLSNQIGVKVKKRRQKELFSVQKKVVQEKLKKKIGQILPVLVEGYHVDSPLLFRGRHQGQCPDIDSEVILNDGRLIERFGAWYPVKITEVAGRDLVGHVVGEMSTPICKKWT